MSNSEFNVFGERSFRQVMAVVAGGQAMGVTEDRVLVGKIRNLTWWGRVPALDSDVKNLTFWILSDTLRIDASVFAQDQIEGFKIADKITGRFLLCFASHVLQ
jgi:hypothetical protein